LDLSRRVDEEE